MATAPPKKTRDLLDQQQAPYQQHFHVTTVTRYLMVSVTSTLHFCDTLHFTITTTTTTTMTMPTTKHHDHHHAPKHDHHHFRSKQDSRRNCVSSPRYIYIYIFFLFFWITNIYLQCVRYASHDDDNRRPLPSTYEGPNDGSPVYR